MGNRSLRPEAGLLRPEAGGSADAEAFPTRIRPKSGQEADFRPDSNQENIKIGFPAGRHPAGGPLLKRSRKESDRNPAKKSRFPDGSTVA